MGLLRRLETRGTVQYAHPRDPVLAAWFGGNLSSAGVAVTPQTAMTLTAVYGCVRILSETMAQIPIHVFKRLDGGAKERFFDHPLYEVLHFSPNNRQTSFEYREMMTGHATLRGCGYSEIVQTNGGKLELIPLHPDRIMPFEAPDYRIAYKYQPLNGASRIILEDEMLKLPGLTFDGVRHESPITQHMNSIGLGLAMQEHGARLFGNNAVPKGGLKVPQGLSEQAVKELRESWNRRHQGPANAGQIAIFDNGLEWQDIGLNNTDAQYLENRRFQTEEIARIFRVPLILLQETTKATSWGTGIEQFMISFIIYTMMPWVKRWEERLNKSLLTEQERKTLFIAFDLKGFMRGDQKSRALFYKTLHSLGALSANDILRAEDMNPIPDGDRYFIPLNLAPVDKLDEILDKKSTPATPGTPDIEDIDEEDDDDEKTQD